MAAVATPPRLATAWAFEMLRFCIGDYTCVAAFLNQEVAVVEPFG